MSEKVKEAFDRLRMVSFEVENVVRAARKVSLHATHSHACRMGVGDPASLCNCGVEELRRALDKTEFALNGHQR